MKETRVELSTIKGRKAIESGDLVYCNTKYHAPYLAVCKGEEKVWQDKLYEGYGRKASCYYAVDKLLPGDLIQCAGGSGGNKYPYKGRVIEVTQTELVLETMTDAEFDNAVIEAAKAEDEEFSREELQALELLKRMSADRIQAILQKIQVGDDPEFIV